MPIALILGCPSRPQALSVGILAITPASEAYAAWQSSIGAGSC